MTDTTLSTIKDSSGTVTFRPGTAADSYAIFNVFEQSLADLSRRLGSSTPTSAADPEALTKMWQERRSLYDHLAHTAESFWIAKRDDQPIGYARSIMRDGVRQLTELFVLPNQQSSGVGRELVARTFKAGGARHRSIIATSDIRAQTLYLKTGVYPRFPLYYFGRKAEAVSTATDLTFVPMTSTPDAIDRAGTLDEHTLGFRRDSDHSWYLTDRAGYFYYRHDQLVGYGYEGVRNGPFALLDPADFPAVLSHAESSAAKHGREFGVEVPTVNQMAVDYLLARGCRLDSFLAILMTDAPFGKFENYIFPSPPFFL